MNEIKRKDAARLLELIIHEVVTAKDQESPVVKNLANRLKEFGLELPRKCTGEAHSNPHIDHCGVCMPNWGWVGGGVKVK